MNSKNNINLAIQNSWSIISHSKTNSLQSHGSYKYLIFIAMLSMTIMICKGIFSYRLVEIDGYVLQAGQLISPLWFILCDVITEVYSYRIAKQIVIASLICQMIFAFVSNKLLQLPFPSFWHDNSAYQVVLGDIWRVSEAVFIAFYISGFINIKLISWWKSLLHGKYFWLRSIGASGFSELLFSVVATLIIQYGKHPIHIILSIILASFIVKLIYSITLSIPANIAVYYLKKTEGFDNFNK